MRLLKGIVVDFQNGFAKIQMETGQVFTAIPTPTMRLRSRVLIAWDFTNDKPHFVYTKKDCEIRASDKFFLEHEIFSMPEERAVEMPDIETSVFDFDMARFSRCPLDDELDDVSIAYHNQH
jgi:hypothetical protein